MLVHRIISELLVLFSRTKQTKPQDRLLVICLAGIGDMFLATPMLAYAKHFPQSPQVVHVITTIAGSQILVNHPAVDRVFVFPSEGSFWEKLSFVYQILLQKYDLVISIRSHLFFTLPFLLSILFGPRFQWVAHFKFERFRVWRGFKNRVRGWRGKQPVRPFYLSLHAILLDILLCDIALRPKVFSSLLEEENPPPALLAIQAPCCLPVSSFVPSLNLTQAEKQEFLTQHILLVSKGLGPFGVLQIAGSHPSRQFPEATLVALLQALVRTGMRIVLLGSNQDTCLVSSPALVDVLSSSSLFINLLGQTTIRQAYFLVQKAHFCIAPDSMLMHMAAAQGTPLVAVMGYDRPQNFGPLYAQGPCVILDKEPPCVRTTTADELMAALHTVLAGSALAEKKV